MTILTTKILHLTTLGFAVLGTASGISLLNAVAPVELLSLPTFGQPNSHQALAQPSPQPSVRPSVQPSAQPSESSPESSPQSSPQSPIPNNGKPTPRVTLDNTPVQGKLDSSSATLPSDNSYFNAYTFEGKAGQLVAIGMSSSEFEPYLVLLTPDGKDLAQADSSGGSSARVITALPADGVYTVLANSSQPSQTGSYSLRLTTAEQGKVLLEQQDSIGPGSPVLRDGSPYKEYQFQGTEGQTVVISLESNDFTPYLLVVDASNQEIGESKEGASSKTNSSLTVTFPTTGAYRVIANSYDSAGKGRYTLTVHDVKVPELNP